MPIGTIVVAAYYFEPRLGNYMGPVWVILWPIWVMIWIPIGSVLYYTVMYLLVPTVQ